MLLIAVDVMITESVTLIDEHHLNVKYIIGWGAKCGSHGSSSARNAGGRSTIQGGGRCRTLQKTNLLNPSEADRPTMAQVLQHEWVTSKGKKD